jgi:hypothetical protein
VNGWSLTYEGFLPTEEGLREALCTLGNGVFATRGAAPEAVADEVHYPGTYAAGVYDRLRTEIAGRTVENEDLVNLPNCWSLFRRRAATGWSLAAEEVLRKSYCARCWSGLPLRMRDVHHRRATAPPGQMHLAALEPPSSKDWSGGSRSAQDGTVTNSGVARYRSLAITSFRGRADPRRRRDLAGGGDAGLGRIGGGREDPPFRGRGGRGGANGDQTRVHRARRRGRGSSGQEITVEKVVSW